MFQNKHKWVAMFISNPLEFEKWLKLEQNGMRYPKILLNGTYSLQQIKDNWKDQTFLSSFEDDEINCSAVNGGCFL